MCSLWFLLIFFKYKMPTCLLIEPKREGDIHITYLSDFLSICLSLYHSHTNIAERPADSQLQ